jgi:hypothetical protein
MNAQTHAHMRMNVQSHIRTHTHTRVNRSCCETSRGKATRPTSCTLKFVCSPAPCHERWRPRCLSRYLRCLFRYLRCCKPPAHLICSISVRVRTCSFAYAPRAYACARGRWEHRRWARRMQARTEIPRSLCPNKIPSSPLLSECTTSLGLAACPSLAASLLSLNQIAERVRAFDCART